MRSGLALRRSRLQGYLRKKGMRAGSVYLSIAEHVYCSTMRFDELRCRLWRKPEKSLNVACLTAVPTLLPGEPLAGLLLKWGGAIAP